MGQVNATPSWLLLDMEKRPQALLDDLASSGQISSTIQEIMNLTQRPDSQIKPVVDALSKSPSLAAEVLKVANSPIFAQNKEIIDLKRAVVLIGMQELHSMSTGLSMLSMFSSDNDISSSMRSTSVVSATIARRFAERVVGVDPVSAFLCGLLCEIGALACNSKDGDGYSEIWNKSQQLPEGRFQMETQRYGIATESTGGKLLRLNGLPQTVSEAIQVSYNEAPTTDNLLGKITCFSRFAAYIIVDAGSIGDREVLDVGIANLAQHMRIENILSKDLVNMCLEAGMQANLGLQGKINLYDDIEESNQDENHETLDITQEINQGARAYKYPILFIVIGIVIAVGAIFLLMSKQ